MKEIRYINGHNVGLISVSAISRVLLDLEKIAKAVLVSENADHVIYASKEYKNNELDCIHFYNPPLVFSDKEFEDRMNGIIGDYQIYALHNENLSNIA